MAEVIGTGSGIIDAKRLRIPGVVIKDKCPNCDHECTRALSEFYLSSPTMNKAEPYHMYCDECDHEWQISLILNISLQIAPEAKNEQKAS